MQQVIERPRLQLLIFGLGALSALALALMIIATRLNLALFGLLSYVEPVLLVVVALLLGESISPDQWLTYGAIWAAIAVLVVEGVRALRRR
ncbi:MAG TPA: multidrug DMT transporter [Pseudomonas sp.]|nr:multidrug DMT transporter [Pseudomonas sp.]